MIYCSLECCTVHWMTTFGYVIPDRDQQQVQYLILSPAFRLHLNKIRSESGRMTAQHNTQTKKHTNKKPYSDRSSSVVGASLSVFYYLIDSRESDRASMTYIRRRLRSVGERKRVLASKQSSSYTTRTRTCTTAQTHTIYDLYINSWVRSRHVINFINFPWRRHSW